MPEIVSLAPFDVAKNENGETWSKSGENYITINYAKLTALLIEVAKLQQKEIEELKARL